MKTMWMMAGSLLLLSSLLSGCPACLEKGSNGVPEPSLGEFQLVFNNIVSRETELLVDGQMAGTVCAATEYATVGNFPVSTETEILIRLLSSGKDCYESPNCDGNCDGQQCWGPKVVDTTPFSGRVFVTGVKWLD